MPPLITRGRPGEKHAAHDRTDERDLAGRRGRRLAGNRRGDDHVGSAPALTIPYDDGLRRDLRAILDTAHGLTAADPGLASAVARLTECHVRAVKALERPADLIGFHGQTILHQPDQRRTWQVGDAALLARETGVPVAYDFRSADVAAGGEGAPFAPAYHAALARDLPRPLAVLNIGGVANVTWIGAKGTGPELATTRS